MIPYQLLLICVPIGLYYISKSLRNRFGASFKKRYVECVPVSANQVENERGFDRDIFSVPELEINAELKDPEEQLIRPRTAITVSSSCQGMLEEPATIEGVADSIMQYLTSKTQSQDQDEAGLINNTVNSRDTTDQVQPTGLAELVELVRDDQSVGSNDSTDTFKGDEEVRESQNQAHTETLIAPEEHVEPDQIQSEVSQSSEEKQEDQDELETPEGENSIQPINSDKDLEGHMELNQPELTDCNAHADPGQTSQDDCITSEHQQEGHTGSETSEKDSTEQDTPQEDKVPSDTNFKTETDHQLEVKEGDKATEIQLEEMVDLEQEKEATDYIEAEKHVESDEQENNNVTSDPNSVTSDPIKPLDAVTSSEHVNNSEAETTTGSTEDIDQTQYSDEFEPDTVDESTEQTTSDADECEVETRSSADQCEIQTRSHADECEVQTGPDANIQTRDADECDTEIHTVPSEEIDQMEAQAIESPFSQFQHHRLPLRKQNDTDDDEDAFSTGSSNQLPIGHKPATPTTVPTNEHQGEPYIPDQGMWVPQQPSASYPPGSGPGGPGEQGEQVIMWGSPGEGMPPPPPSTPELEGNPENNPAYYQNCYTLFVPTPYYTYTVYPK